MRLLACVAVVISRRYQATHQADTLAVLCEKVEKVLQQQHAQRIWTLENGTRLHTAPPVNRTSHRVSALTAGGQNVKAEGKMR